MSLQCVILAGGLGTRIRHLFPHVPKALIPINDRPFISYQLEKLNNQGITNVIIATGFMSSEIQQAVTAHTPTGMKVSCITDGEQLRGTGGAIRRLADLSMLDNIFFVTYGDSYLLTDLNPVSNAFDTHRFEALMTVHRNERLQDANNASVLNDGSVRYLKGLEDPSASGLDMIDYGLSVIMKSSVLSRIPSGQTVDLAEYFREVSADGALQGYLVEDDFFEIGSPDGIHEFSKFITDGKLH